jgi:hypothetical protein
MMTQMFLNILRLYAENFQLVLLWAANPHTPYSAIFVESKKPEILLFLLLLF